MKRKRAMGEEDEDRANPKKRPASVMKRPGALAIAKVNKKPAAAEDEKEGRDRLKQLAFDRMFVTLPKWAQQTWDKTLKGPGMRDRRTEFINAIVQKSAKGK